MHQLWLKSINTKAKQINMDSNAHRMKSTPAGLRNYQVPHTAHIPDSQGIKISGAPNYGELDKV